MTIIPNRNRTPCALTVWVPTHWWKWGHQAGAVQSIKELRANLQIHRSRMWKVRPTLTARPATAAAVVVVVKSGTAELSRCGSDHAFGFKTKSLFGSMQWHSGSEKTAGPPPVVIGAAEKQRAHMPATRGPEWQPAGYRVMAPESARSNRLVHAFLWYPAARSAERCQQNGCELVDLSRVAVKDVVHCHPVLTPRYTQTTP